MGSVAAVVSVTGTDGGSVGVEIALPLGVLSCVSNESVSLLEFASAALEDDFFCFFSPLGLGFSDFNFRFLVACGAFSCPLEGAQDMSSISPDVLLVDESWSVRNSDGHFPFSCVSSWIFLCLIQY